MKIIRGIVAGVFDAGTTEKPYARVAITEVTKDRDGLESTSITKFIVAGKQFKDGLQNAYRPLVGVEVFVPVTAEINDYNGTKSIRFNLEGVPLRLQDIPAAAPVKAAG